MRLGIALIVVLWAGMAVADPLAHLRQDLERLRSDLSVLDYSVKLLRTENPVVAGTMLERFALLETELRRLTNILERMEHTTQTFKADGERRLADLEERLCALEEGCVSVQESVTSSNVGQGLPNIPTALQAPRQTWIGGKPAVALIMVDEILTSSPSFEEYIGALHLKSGVLADLGQYEASAMIAIDGYAAAPNGHYAPFFLMSVAGAFFNMDKREEFCLILAEVSTQFPKYPLEAVIAETGWPDCT